MGRPLAELHGTVMAHRKYACRCEICVGAKVRRDAESYHRRMQIPSVEEPGTTNLPRCGTVTAYRCGCTCDDCREAHRKSMADWREKMKAHAKAKRATAAARKVPHAGAVADQVQSAVSRPNPTGFRLSLTREDALRQRRG